MAEIYFVRHAQPNYDNHDDRNRELTPKGMKDRERVTAFLRERNIGAVLSSPYRRAYDTVAGFAGESRQAIHVVEDFRERKVGNEWIPDFNAFARAQWADFTYKLPGGECLREVQARNIRALNKALEEYPDMNLAIGSHGTAMSVVIHHFDPLFGYEEFRALQGLMPGIVQFTLEGTRCLQIQWHNLYA